MESSGTSLDYVFMNAKGSSPSKAHVWDLVQASEFGTIIPLVWQLFRIVVNVSADDSDVVECDFLRIA